MPKPFKPLERSPLLSQSVQDAIRAYILDNTLGAGDPLPPETELAKQLGVSRNSVREAVKSLESLGILETRRGTGLFVRDFSFEPLLDNLSYALLSNKDELAELLVVRRVLETGLIEAAMQAMSDVRRAELRQIVEQMRVLAEQGAAFPDEDRQFHQCLFEGLQNKTLLRLLDIFWLTFRKAAEYREDIRDSDPLRTYRDHAAIAEAVLANDGEQAQRALGQHYAGLAGRLHHMPHK